MWRRSVFFVLILLTACAASAPNRVVARKVEDYLGKWSGRWDNTFYVQFTVTQEPETKHVLVLYEWEEYPGQPLQRLRLTGHIENNILKIGTRFIELSVSPHDPDKGKAYGYFRTRRTAELTREKRVTRRTATDELRWSTFQGSADGESRGFLRQERVISGDTSVRCILRVSGEGLLRIGG